jgi:hypothetical protein
MNEMNADNRYYDDAFYGNRESYRGNYRDNYRDSYRYDNRMDYRDDYREDYRGDYRTRDYDRRGGKINNRNYRNYREQDYYEELEMTMQNMKEQHRKLEDIAEMAHNMQDKNMLMKIAQKEKENYNYLKQLAEK